MVVIEVSDGAAGYYLKNVPNPSHFTDGWSYEREEKWIQEDRYNTAEWNAYCKSRSKSYKKDEGYEFAIITMLLAILLGLYIECR